MKALFVLWLLVFTLGSSAFGDDLMSLGKDEKDATGTSFSPFQVTNIDEYVKNLPYPASQNPEDYVNYFGKYIELTQKNLVALAAQRNPQVLKYERSKWGIFPKLEMARCLSHPQAYEIKAVSTKEFELQCLAGIGKNATHVLRYRITVAQQPADCATVKIREFFNVAANRNKVAAERFDQEMRSGARCLLSANPTYPGSPVVESRKLDKKALETYLTREDKQDLKHYIAGTGKADRKVSSEDDDNPFGRGLGAGDAK